MNDVVCLVSLRLILMWFVTHFVNLTWITLVDLERIDLVRIDLVRVDLERVDFKRVDLSRRGWSPRTEYRSHTWSPPLAADGPTLGMVFSKARGVKADKWTRKNEAVYAVSLRLGFEGELNIGIHVCSKL